jgi:hypothetical protein
MDAALRLGSSRQVVGWTRDRDPSDPHFQAVELAQRGRMVVDVATADLAAAESRLGAFHETTWYFRNALAEARRAWDRLRADLGSRVIENALAEPPLAVLDLNLRGRATARCVAIGGKTYRVESVPGTDLARVLWRLTRLPEPDDGPYYVGRLADGTVHCDCAGWTYQDDEPAGPRPCKHLHGLAALGWI